MVKQDISNELKVLIEGANIPGLAVAVGGLGAPSLSWYAGQTTLGPDAMAVSRETLFDLASLTKVLTTHQWFLMLVSQGLLRFDDTVGRYFPNASKWLARCPLWRLANHTSGLAAHVAFYESRGEFVLSDGHFEREYHQVIQDILKAPETYEMGSQQIYSDLGYILLAAICESVHEPIAVALEQLSHHGLDEIHWCSSLKTAAHELPLNYAATEMCPWRRRLLVGEVHDDNCWLMGGMAGHAGAFGNLETVHGLALEWLRAFSGLPNDLPIDPQVINESLTDRFHFANSTRILGWDRTSKKGSSSGRHFTPMSYGHLGFTGTSIWIDVEEQLVVTLLTNRVCPTRNNPSIQVVRPAVHDLVIQHYLAKAK